MVVRWCQLRRKEVVMNAFGDNCDVMTVMIMALLYRMVMMMTMMVTAVVEGKEKSANNEVADAVVSLQCH